MRSQPSDEAADRPPSQNDETTQRSSSVGTLTDVNVDEFLELIVAGGGEIYACKLAADMFNLTKDDLHDDVTDIITVGDRYEMCDGPGTQIIFT